MHFQACFPYPNLSLTKTAIFWNYVSDLVGLHKEYKNYFFFSNNFKADLFS